MKTAILILTLASSLSAFDIFSSTNAKRIQGKNVGSLSLCADGDALKWVSANNRFECVSATGGGDASTNTATSVDSEIVLFSGTSGKTLKRATASGVAKVTSGVLGVVSGTSTNCVLVDGTSAACGSGGGAPTGAQYLTLATDATLTAERVLTPDTNMSVTDAGAGGAYTFGPDTAKILSRATHQAGALGCSDSGGDDTYTCNMTPTLTTYTAGMVVEFTATVTANTGGATLQIDSLAGGGKAIKLCDGTTDPETGDIAIGRQVPLRYDGTVFRLPCKGGSSGTPTNTPYFPWGGVDINNVIGASTALNVRFYEFDIFSPGKIITSLSTATGSTGGIFAFALYSADCTTLLAQTDTVNVIAFDDDQIFVFTSPQTLTAGKYVLGIAEQAGTGLLRRTFGYYLPVGGRDSTNFPYFRVTGVDATYSAPNLTMPSACTGTRVSLNAASPYALAPFIAFF